jgi:predicted nucleic acid-binding protein
VKQVFVDSGGFFALLVPQDHSHAAALDVFARAELEHWSLVTTNIVVIETYALLLARTRPGRLAAIGFLDALQDSGVRIERVRRVDEEGAETLVRMHEDKDYSLCDALSFVVMERLGIGEAVAYDRNFQQYGRFRVL